MRIIYKPVIGDVYTLLQPLTFRARYGTIKQTFPEGTKFIIEGFHGDSYSFQAKPENRVRLRLNIWGEHVWVYFAFLNNRKVQKLDGFNDEIKLPD